MLSALRVTSAASSMAGSLFRRSQSTWGQKTANERATTSLLHILPSQQEGVKILKFQSPPVNTLTREVLKELLQKLRTLNGDETVKGVVVSSGVSNVFSAGLNLHELHCTDVEKLKSYLDLVQKTFLALYPFPKPMVAAMTGASPAGGLWLSLCADHRIAVDNDRYKMGLNEATIGIIAPFYFAIPLAHCVGPRVSERMLQLGQLLTPKEALKVGLVDELKATPEECEKAAVDVAAQYAAMPFEARSATKLQIRRPLVDRLYKEREAEMESFAMQIAQPSVQAHIGKYIEGMKAKKAAKERK
jgi:Delta3-Delta2-enoyl-CoA isomerase